MQSANYVEVCGLLATLTHNSTPSPRSIIYLSGRPVLLGPLSNVVSRLSRPYLTVLLSLMLLAGLTGCGQAGSGNTPGLEARSSTSGSAGQGGKTLIPADQGDKPLAKSAVTPDNSATVEDKKIKSVEEKKSAALPVPDAIARDFESPYARIRLQALDYWATQGTKAPLDPLLEALEDEDEEVRTKAAKIAEEKWGIKQELD